MGNSLRLSDTYICISKPTTIGSDNGLSLGQCQAIIWISAGMLLIWPLGTNFSEISIKINVSLFKKIILKMLSPKCGPFSLSLNVLTVTKKHNKSQQTINGIITVPSQWARWHLKSPASRLFAQPFVQVQIKENIKALRHWPLWRESTSVWWIPLTKGQ